MTVRQRYAEARAQAERAKAHAIAASQAKLRELLRAPRDERFKALADSDLILREEDRLALTESLMDDRDRRRVLLPDTAGWFVRWRSRTFYQPMLFVKYGVAVGLAVGCLTWSAKNSPIQWVIIDPKLNLVGYWAEPDGTTAEFPLSHGAQYQLLSLRGDIATLREWRPGRGYATLRIAVSDLLGAPESSATRDQ